MNFTVQSFYFEIRPLTLSLVSLGPDSRNYKDENYAQQFDEYLSSSNCYNDERQT